MRQTLGLILVLGVILGSAICQSEEQESLDQSIIQSNLEKFIGDTESRLNHGDHSDSIETTWSLNIGSVASFDQLFQLLVDSIDQRIGEIQAVKSGRSQECQSFLETTTNATNQAQAASDEIDRLQDLSASNVEKIEKIFDDKCQTHQNYLNFLKSSKITLRLLDFLEQAIESYSLVQIRSVGKILSQYKDSKLSSQEILQAMLAELKQVDQNSYKAASSLENQTARRTAEEIGQKHIDDGRDEIEVDNFQSSERRLIEDYKEDILKIIGQIRTQLQDEISSRQNSEIDLNERVIQWTTNLNVENEQLAKQISDLEFQLKQLNDQLTSLNYINETCNAELEWIEDKISGYEQFRTEFIGQEELWRQRYDYETSGQTQSQEEGQGETN